MSDDDTTELLLLMGVDAIAMRLYHTFGLLERVVNEQKKSMLDILLGIVGGLVTLIDYLTFLQLPTTITPYVMGVSIVVLAVVVYQWWRSRNRGYEALATVRKFGMYLDQVRRCVRELRVAEGLADGQTNRWLKTYIQRSLKTAIEGIDGLEKQMKELDFFTLGETKSGVDAEIIDARHQTT